MWIWPALLLAPLLVVADVSVLYALSEVSCQSHRMDLLHGVSLTVLLLAMLFTLMAWRAARAPAGPGAPAHADNDQAEGRHHFAACVATGTGALSSIVVAALAYPPWVLSPCVG